jgi:hypothetical protein
MKIILKKTLPFRDAAQGIFKNLSGDLHGAYSASAGAVLLGQTYQPLPGRLAHRHLGMPHPTRDGWPTWTETLSRFKAGLNGRDDLGQPGGTERTPSGMRHLTYDRRPEPGGDFFDVFGHVDLPPFLAFRLPRRRGLFQGEADFKVVVVDHQSDSSLPRLASHPIAKVPQRWHLLLDRMLACVALNDDRLVKQELAALGVVTPDAPTLLGMNRTSNAAAALPAPRAPAKSGMKTSVSSSASIRLSALKVNRGKSSRFYRPGESAKSASPSRPVTLNAQTPSPLVKDRRRNRSGYAM